MTNNFKILFLGETYRADAITWIKGIEKASGCKIDTLEISNSNYRSFRLLKAFIFIIKLFYLRFFGPKYDIVLAERSTSYGFFSLFTNAKVKVVAQQGITDIFPDNKISKLYKIILQHIAYRNADVIHAWGAAMVYAQLKSGACPSKILVRPKGLDLKRYTFTNHFNQKNIQLQAIVSRSLEIEYRHEDIIEALSILNEKEQFFKIIFVGGGSLIIQLKQKSIELGVADLIEFKGRIPNEELPILLSQCPIYISTPITEGVSSSLFESMASGCVSIVTDLPGNKAFIKPNFNGELVPVSSPQKIAEYIIKVISNFKTYEKGIFANREFIDQNVNIEVNMEIFFNHYLNILKKK
jgi:glycosyltransferase involved in cell wall biosynthesis